MCTNRFSRPIMTKPKPAKPASPEVPPSPPPQSSEQQPQGASGEKDGIPEGAEVPPPPAEPMDTSKSDASHTAN